MAISNLSPTRFPTASPGRGLAHSSTRLSMSFLTPLDSHTTPVRFPGLLSSVFLPSEKGRNITNICGCQITNQIFLFDLHVPDVV
ncbi:Cap-Gly Domain-Containing Linker Protein 2 [Manis pentadactyla]|nr:Cap-Gly Domain-Containing Linker Protein 2 [Manis pentadactyla]